MSTEQAPIQFVKFLVKESHISINKTSEFKIDIDFKLKGTVLKSNGQFILEISTFVKDVNGNFNIHIVTDSVFTFPQDADIEEYKKSYFVLNAPAIIFPYIRAYVSSLTALSGMPTLNLPTLNLSQVGSGLKDNITIVD